MAQLLKPDDEDYFVLKPKQSAFYGTTLDTLLRSLGTTTVILTGIAGDNCVLFSANDAYMRDLEVVHSVGLRRVEHARKKTAPRCS